VDTSSPGPTRAAAAGGGDSPSPGKGDQETSLVVKGWSQLCSAVLTKVGSSIHGARTGGANAAERQRGSERKRPDSTAAPPQGLDKLSGASSRMSTDSMFACFFVACPCSVLQGADWLFTAKGAERQIDKILGEYYEAPAQSRGASRQRNAERPSAKVTLDKIANIVDSRMKQLRRQEDEVSRGFWMCEQVFQLICQDVWGLAKCVQPRLLWKRNGCASDSYSFQCCFVLLDRRRRYIGYRWFPQGSPHPNSFRLLSCVLTLFHVC